MRHTPGIKLGTNLTNKAWSVFISLLLTEYDTEPDGCNFCECESNHGHTIKLTLKHLTRRFINRSAPQGHDCMSLSQKL